MFDRDLLRRIKSLEEFLGVKYHKSEHKHEDDEHYVTDPNTSWNRMAVLDAVMKDNRKKDR